ncbi:ABC-three component system protein [Rheinheimera pacifica]|uniref:ABC-three component system protein n=1 Tax=Rheinheimera pacifica TaxID=173990 RepID=UPI0038621652
MNDEDRGQLLYYQCRKNSSAVKLEYKDVDDFFSHGSLQVLSDSQDIGWHPNYEIVLKGGNDDT